MKNLIFFLAIVCSTIPNLSAQQNYEPDQKYAVTKTDGTIYLGRILSDDGREILMDTEKLGKIYIPKSDIKSIKKIDEEEMKRGNYVGDNIFTTRYQFSTNAFPINKHQNYATINLYGPEVHFSVANNFSVGIMSTWIGSPMALALKYTVTTKNPKLNFGAGTLIGSSGYINQARGFGGLHWLMATYGDKFNNITASFGFGYFNNGDREADYLVLPGTYSKQVTEWGAYDFILPMESYGSNTYKAPIVGLSGMFTIGDRATFIIDVMTVFATRERFYQTSVYDGPDMLSSNQVTFSTPILYNATSNNFIFMPAMRFKNKNNSSRAFQISLAGVIGSHKFRESNFYASNLGQELKNKYSFPIPMATWFFGF
jgi:hypothetical protein